MVSHAPRSSDDKPLTLKVRPLLVDARVKEFTLGPAHDVTDRLFVIRRAFRVNDSLPQEAASPPHWQWQRGGWLLVDRLTGRISPINLPEFDALYSAASWYRDYAAYCGISEDGKKLYAVVAQITRRKPVLKKPLDGQTIPENAATDSACPTPAWQRSPARVTFEPAGAPKANLRHPRPHRRSGNRNRRTRKRRSFQIMDGIQPRSGARVQPRAQALGQAE